MNEVEWVEEVAKQLKINFELGSNILIETQRNLSYAYEIHSYDENWEVSKGKTSPYTTDLLIFEKNESVIKPRVVIEAKIKGVTTHDAITYSQKATTHKSVHPYLRYGIMLGCMGSTPMQARLFRHGSNFDFMLNFKSFELSQEELLMFTELLKQEIKISRAIEELLFESRSRSRKKYWALQKSLVLWE